MMDSPTRFSRVRWSARGADLTRRGADGTIIWIDVSSDQASYVLELDDGAFLCARSEDLKIIEGRSMPERHTGITAEISHDLIPAEWSTTRPFHEGVYRLCNRFWEVFTVSRRDVERIAVNRHLVWHSGIAGTTITVPAHLELSVGEVEHHLAAAWHVPGWARVRGPDSMWLR